MEEEMREFYVWGLVPRNFTGKCKIEITNSICHYKNGKLHRLDGPAMEHELATPEYYVEGKKYSKARFNKIPEVIMYKAGLGVFV